MTTTRNKLADAITAVEAARPDLQCIFTNHALLKKQADAARVSFSNNIAATSGDGSPLHIDRGHPTVGWFLQSQAVLDFVTIDSIVQAVESSPGYAEAVAEIAPLVATVRQLEKQLAEELALAGAAENERREKIEAAREKALAKIDRDFAIAG
jgi:hypothetical protein